MIDRAVLWIGFLLFLSTCGIPSAISARTDHFVIGEGETVQVNVLDNDLPDLLTLVDLAGPLPRGLIRDFDDAGNVTIVGIEPGHWEITYEARPDSGGARSIEGILVVDVVSTTTTERPPETDPPVTPPPEIIIEPRILEFGDLILGEMAERQTLVTNVSPSEFMNILDVQISPPYEFLANRDNCTHVPPGDQCLIVVAFRPAERGDAHQSVPIEAEGYLGTTLQLTGNAHSPPISFEVSPNPIFMNGQQFFDAEIRNTGRVLIEEFEFESSVRIALDPSGCVQLELGGLCGLFVAVSDEAFETAPFSDRFIVRAGTESVTVRVEVPPPPTEFAIAACHWNNERVFIENVGAMAATLDGWSMHDAEERHWAGFPEISGRSIGPGETVVALSGDDPTATRDNEFVWYEADVWNDDEPDTAFLVNPDGDRVSQLDCDYG